VAKFVWAAAAGIDLALGVHAASEGKWAAASAALGLAVFAALVALTLRGGKGE
jgi:hypothetical protein